MDTDVDMDTDSAQWDRPLQLDADLVLAPVTGDIDGRTVA
jgi:hypothetical protein